MRVNLVSFGFKHGVPGNVGLVLDVRSIRNPHRLLSLRDLTGLHEKVRREVLRNPFTPALLSHGVLMVERCDRDGRYVLTMGVGCYGGNHRSVAIAEELARLLRPRYLVTVKHKDMRDVQASPPG